MKARPRILALDLATATGWAHGLIGDEAPIFETKLLPKTGEDIGRFLSAYEEWLAGMIAEVKPDRIFFEAPILSQRSMTARKLMGLAGLTEMVCHRAKVPVEEAVLSSVKLFFAGNGRAEKVHMIEAARKRGLQVTDDNQADACGVWLFGCATIDPALRELAAPKLVLPPKKAKPKPKPRKTALLAMLAQ